MFVNGMHGVCLSKMVSRWGASSPHDLRRVNVSFSESWSCPFCTLKPLSRTISVRKPELAREVYAGKSFHLAFSWGQTYRKNLASCNHYLFSLYCIDFTCPTWRFTIVWLNTCQCQMLRSGCALVLRQHRSYSC